MGAQRIVGKAGEQDKPRRVKGSSQGRPTIWWREEQVSPQSSTEDVTQPRGDSPLRSPTGNGAGLMGWVTSFL